MSTPEITPEELEQLRRMKAELEEGHQYLDSLGVWRGHSIKERIKDLVEKRP